MKFALEKNFLLLPCVCFSIKLVILSELLLLLDKTTVDKSNATHYSISGSGNASCGNLTPEEQTELAELEGLIALTKKRGENLTESILKDRDELLKKKGVPKELSDMAR